VVLLPMTRRRAALHAVVVALLILFPPWRATFHSLDRTTVPDVTLSLSWPSPDFAYGNFIWTRSHAFGPLVSILSPPQPRSEVYERNIVGLWSTQVDSTRLLLFVLVAVLVIGSSAWATDGLARRVNAAKQSREDPD
jgi:hypothetical protein